MPLQDDIQKKTPFQSSEEELFLNLIRTEAIVGGEIDCFLKDHGITEQQYNVLRILRGAAEEGGLPALEVGRRMVTRVPDISRMIIRLENQGWVERRRCDRDRRVIYIRLTKKGEQLAATLEQPLLAKLKETLGHLSENEKNQLITLLERARNRPKR